MAADLRFEKILDDPSRDVVALRARLYINGEASTAVNVVVSGYELRTVGLTDPEAAEHPGALLSCGAPHVANAYAYGQLPLRDGRGVFEVRVSGIDVQRMIDSNRVGTAPIALQLRETEPALVRVSSNRLDKISIENFCGIRSAQTIEFGKLTFFVGANGSGKSRALSAFEMLTAAAIGQTAAPLSLNQSWRPRRPTGPTRFEVQLVGSAWRSEDVPDSTVDFTCEINPSGDEQKLEIHRERLTSSRGVTEFERPSFSWDLAYRARATLDGSATWAEIGSPFERDLSALPFLSDFQLFPVATSVSNFFENTPVYRCRDL